MLELMRTNRYEHDEPSAEQVRHVEQGFQVFVWAGRAYATG